MKSTFVEAYQTLGDMLPGDIAVSKDRTQVFICGNHFDPVTNISKRTILDMNDLFYESGQRDMTTKVKMLLIGDKFTFEK